MLISKTPYRVSLFGGGTDYPSWYSKYGGATLSTTINHYCYINARWLPPFHDEKSRIVWSRIEAVAHHMDILHPAVRSVLKHLGIERGVEIHHMGDLPARSGLGSSSSFTVGLLNALSALQGRSFNKSGLALESVHIERDVMQENVGIQDQIAASYGGFNHTTISEDGSFFVAPVETHRLGELQSNMLLFFTGVTRTASHIAAEQVEAHKTGAKDRELMAMQGMVDEALNIIRSRGNIDALGYLLHESWKIKRSLAVNVSPPMIDEIYEMGRKSGAIGGKLLGAGGGGFMLFFAAPDRHENIKNALNNLVHVPFRFEDEGSSIIFDDKKEV